MKLEALAAMGSWDWPDDAGATLLQVLRDREADAGDRLLATELAGDVVVMNDGIASALLGLAEAADEAVDLRGQAAISLGPALEWADLDGFDDPDEIVISEEMFDRIQETLQRLHGDDAAPKELRCRALEASVRAPQEWHREAIRAAYGSEDAEWRRTAVFGMRHVRGFDQTILEALESPDAETEIEAILAAGAWELDEAAAHVTAILSSEDAEKERLLAAIEAIPFLRPNQAADLLADLLESDDEDIVDAAREALGLPTADDALLD